MKIAAHTSIASSKIMARLSLRVHFFQPLDFLKIFLYNHVHLQNWFRSLYKALAFKEKKKVIFQSNLWFDMYQKFYLK